MKNITAQQFKAAALASIACSLPIVALAHGGVDDGHVEEVVDMATRSTGASELIKAWTPRWWGLLITSTILTSLLSYGVWKYMQVAPHKKSPAEPADPTPAQQ